MNPFDPQNEDAMAVLYRELEWCLPEELEKPVEIKGRVLLQILELLKTLVDEAHQHDGYNVDGSPSPIFEKISERW